MALSDIKVNIGKKNSKTTKRGLLSEAEKLYIEKNCHIKTDVEIAGVLNRPVGQIEKQRAAFLSQHKSLGVKQEEIQALRDELHAEPEWEIFKRSMTASELTLFEHSYVALMGQFDSDVMATEKKQIFQALTIEIKIHRHNLEVMRTQTDIERMEKIRNEYYEIPNKSDDDKRTIQHMEEMIAASRNASSARTKEYKDLSDKFSNLLKDLKGTREARISRIEQSKETFVGIIRKLEEEESRKLVFAETTAVGQATANERQRVFADHVFADGVIDKPFLTAESVGPIEA